MADWLLTVVIVGAAVIFAGAFIVAWGRMTQDVLTATREPETELDGDCFLAEANMRTRRGL